MFFLPSLCRFFCLIREGGVGGREFLNASDADYCDD